MLYRKNLPGWERAVRAVGGIAMMTGGLLWPGLAGTPSGMLLAAAGASALLTGFIGVCPACAMVGLSLIHI